jgi:hypothetical protein
MAQQRDLVVAERDAQGFDVRRVAPGPPATSTMGGPLPRSS